jgi:UDP-sulfoquinovose synthase
MRVFIAGVDGYLGWSLAQYLAAKGHIVTGVDNCRRREWVGELGSQSVIPIDDLGLRIRSFKKHFGRVQFLSTYYGTRVDAANLHGMLTYFDEFEPDVIVNLAQMPSAPYSMISYEKCVQTHRNNIETTLAILWAMNEVCPDSSLVMIGTAGEYGTPGVAIPEGFFDIEYRGRKANLPFPRLPASFYHATKVHSSVNIERACHWWGLRATDIMQGVVYGVKHENMVMPTRFDIDEAFGTAINRFVCQSIIGEPITVYGKGQQRRGFIPLRDAMKCLSLVIENPPKKGEYRVINQYDQVYGLLELAQQVQQIANEYCLDAHIKHIENPRVELEEHFYEMDREKLVSLGYEPQGDIATELIEMFETLMPYRKRIQEIKHVLMPTIKWNKQNA